MQGMSTADFQSKLKKLNSQLWVDKEKISYPYSRDYPTCGLYLNQKFILGVPQGFVPEWSIMGANLTQLQRSGKEEVLKSLLDRGLPPNNFPLEDRILWRGYRVILASLAYSGYIDQYEAGREFRCDIYPLQMNFPRHYIQLEI